MVALRDAKLHQLLFRDKKQHFTVHIVFDDRGAVACQAAEFSELRGHSFSCPSLYLVDIVGGEPADFRAHAGAVERRRVLAQA